MFLCTKNYEFCTRVHFHKECMDIEKYAFNILYIKIVVKKINRIYLEICMQIYQIMSQL